MIEALVGRVACANENVFGVHAFGLDFCFDLLTLGAAQKILIELLLHPY